MELFAIRRQPPVYTLLPGITFPESRSQLRPEGQGVAMLEAAADLGEKATGSRNKASTQLHCTLTHHVTLQGLPNFPKYWKLEGQLRLVGTA